jgi:16S rRNA (guanine966-N2)-methyltransferase
VRIVAGSARGRALKGPRSASIRPTADRVRESLFNVLGQWMEGQSVLDLYAGTGALALEALSRGAVRAVMVDQDREAVALCRENAAALGFTAQVQVMAMPVARAVEQLAARGERFELVFADPPYAALAAAGVLELVSQRGLLAPEGTLVIEHDRREVAPERHGALARVDERKFGDTRLSLFRLVP